MKSLREFFEESAYAAENPVPGDHFDIELSTDTLIETVVTHITEDGMVIDLDESALALLTKSGMLIEDSDLSIAMQSADSATGVMSPISGNNFLPYDRKQDPRHWMSKDKRDKQHKEVGDKDNQDEAYMDAIRGLGEAKYHGRTVPLGKPMAGDVKKSKVYVRKPNGSIVKVNFGDKTMRIKKSNPGRRKNFRARHHCENPGPRWKARYWSCRAW